MFGRSFSGMPPVVNDMKKRFCLPTFDALIAQRKTFPGARCRRFLLSSLAIEARQIFHLAKAFDLEAVVLTHDVDFLAMALKPGTAHRGIILAHAKNVSMGGCIREVDCEGFDRSG
jgi:hypothetical protein